MITKNYRSRNSCQNHSDCFSYEYCDSEFLCYSCFEYDSFCDTYNGLCPGHCSAYTLNEGLEDCVECWDELNECIDDSDCVIINTCGFLDMAREESVVPANFTMFFNFTATSSVGFTKRFLPNFTPPVNGFISCPLNLAFFA